ncbi:MAG: hypothetical protein GPJ54_20215 [Candidatus Heimdallarchaeota archaeon]|nr:hypothetical protein [Candidatus Heimdallarchaeota archaeon]
MQYDDQKEKQVLMLRNIFDTYDKMRELHDGGVELEQITNLDLFDINRSYEI